MKRLLLGVIIASTCFIALDNNRAIAGEPVSIGIKFNLSNRNLVDDNNRIVGSLGLHMEIVEVLPNSAAHLAGLRAGDSIIMIDGVFLKDLRDEMELFVILDKAPGNELKIEALREIKKYDPNTPGPIDPKEYYETKNFVVVISKAFIW